MLAKSSNCRGTEALPKKSWYTFPCFEECTPVSFFLFSTSPERGDGHCSLALRLWTTTGIRVLLRSYPESQIAGGVGFYTLFYSQVAGGKGPSRSRVVEAMQQFEVVWILIVFDPLIHFDEWFALKLGPDKYVFEMPFFCVCLLAVLPRVGHVENRYGVQKGFNHQGLFTDVAISCNVVIFPIILLHFYRNNVSQFFSDPFLFSQKRL